MLGYFATYFGQCFYILLVFYLTLLWDIALFNASLYKYFTVRFMLFLCLVTDFEWVNAILLF